jgi:hypothetical protein
MDHAAKAQKPGKPKTYRRIFDAPFGAMGKRFVTQILPLTGDLPEPDLAPKIGLSAFRGPRPAALLAAQWRAAIGRAGFMVTRPLTMIKRWLPNPVFFDPPDR